jgi:hypothetical protein
MPDAEPECCYLGNKPDSVNRRALISWACGHRGADARLLPGEQRGLGRSGMVPVTGAIGPWMHPAGEAIWTRASRRSHRSVNLRSRVSGGGFLADVGREAYMDVAKLLPGVGAVVTAEETLLKLYDLHKQMANMAKQYPQT